MQGGWLSRDDGRWETGVSSETRGSGSMALGLACSRGVTGYGSVARLDLGPLAMATQGSRALSSLLILVPQYLTSFYLRCAA